MVCCVAAAGDEQSADAALIITRIEHMPGAAEIDLHASREIHRCIDRRHPDVAEVGGAIARRNVHRPAQRNGQMRHVPAHAAFFVVRLEGGLGGTGIAVAEPRTCVDEVADGLHPAPARRQLSEPAPRIIEQQVALAIAARHEKLQRVGRQRLHGNFRRVEAGVAKSRAARAQADAAARAASLSSDRYAAGVATQLDVTQAQRDAFLASAAKIQADADLAFARASLRLAAGVPVSDKRPR